MPIDPEVRRQAVERVADLKAVRDEAHKAAERAKAEADEEMWKAIAAELDNGQLRQVDVVEATGFSRDHVLRRTKPYREQKKS